MTGAVGPIDEGVSPIKLPIKSPQNLTNANISTP